MLQRKGTVVEQDGISYLVVNGEQYIIPSANALQYFIDFDTLRYDDLQSIMTMFDSADVVSM